MNSIVPIFRSKLVQTSMSTQTFNSDAVRVEGNRVVLSMMVYTYSGTSLVVGLQGSMDGTTWRDVTTGVSPVTSTVSGVGYATEVVFTGCAYPLLRIYGTATSVTVVFDASFAFSQQ